MPVYLIGYDLVKPDHDYSPLIDAIKNIGPWWHCLDSTLLVSSDKTAVEIRNSLMPYIHPNHDRLLVAKMGKGAAWTKSFNKNCSDWLKRNL